MQTIYVQGAVFRLINAISLAIAAFALLLGILFRDPIVFMLLFVSLGFPLLSLMTLIDHIKYDDQSMQLQSIKSKRVIKYSNIKEIFYSKDSFVGCSIVINMEVAFQPRCNSSASYLKKCKAMRIIDTINMTGMTFKDLKKILSYYRGSVVTNIENTKPE